MEKTEIEKVDKSLVMHGKGREGKMSVREEDKGGKI